MAAILGFEYASRHVNHVLVLSHYQTDCDRSSLEPAWKALKVFRHELRKEITSEGLDFSERANEKTIQDILRYSLDGTKVQQGEHTLIRKVGKKTVVFANNFANFLQAYSGVVEIMKGADQQYGGLAYGTLSLLLVVSGLLRGRVGTC